MRGLVTAASVLLCVLLGGGVGRHSEAARPIAALQSRQTMLGCPRGPALTVLPALSLAVVGTAPVWVVGLDPDGPLPLGLGNQAKHGWPIKIPWLEKRAYTGTVMVQVRAWPHGRLLWLQGADQRPHTILVLDPRHPSFVPLRKDTRHPGRLVTDSAWKGFSSMLFIPRAGCYMLQARWPGGRWSVPFTAE